MSESIVLPYKDGVIHLMNIGSKWEVFATNIDIKSRKGGKNDHREFCAIAEGNVRLKPRVFNTQNFNKAKK